MRKHLTGRKHLLARDMLYKLSFKQRIWASFVLLIILAIAATGSISYLIASRVVQKNAFQSSQDAVNKAAQILDDKLRNTANSVRALMLSDPFKQQLMRDVQSGNATRYYQHLSSLQSVFSQANFSDSLIENILVATPIGDFYFLNFVRNPNASFYETDMYREIKETRRGAWIQGHEDTFFSSRQRVLSLVVEGVGEDPQFPPFDTYVIVNIKEKELMRLSTQNLSKDGREYYVINPQGEQVVRSDSSPVWGDDPPDFPQQMDAGDHGSFFYEGKNETYMLNYKRLDINHSRGWMVVGVQSKDQLLREVSQIKQTAYLTMLGFVLLSLLFANKLTNVLLRPLYKLQMLMRRVEDNDLAVRFESKFQDEVAQVGSRFNRMLDEISRLIEDVRKGETEKRKSEMKALTAQMNPHFFYNTLNTIYCKSVLGENEDASAMILALSEMFQLSLNAGKELIPLQDELKHAEQYVAIQQISYENLFTFHTEVEEERLLQCLVPKIILQPLVENSILHGFRNRRSGGEIRVSVRSSDGILQLSVEDNGEGLPPGNAAADTSEEKGSGRTRSRHGYAMPNITHRLQLYFGNDAGLALSSRPGGGARVDIWLPIVEEEQKDER